MDNDPNLTAIDNKVARYRAKLVDKLEQTRKNQESYKTLIESVYAPYGGVTINLPALISLCLQKLGANQDTWHRLQEELDDYIHLHAERKEWIEIKRGKSGIGVSLIIPHIKQGMMGATCNSIIVKPIHSRKKRATKRKSK